MTEKHCERCGRKLPVDCPQSVYGCMMGTGCADYSKKTKMISSTKWIDFNVNWVKGKYKGLRFGQAFMNEFFPQENNSEIFFEEDLVKVINLCRSFVDSNKIEANRDKTKKEAIETIEKNLKEM